VISAFDMLPILPLPAKAGGLFHSCCLVAAYFSDRNAGLSEQKVEGLEGNPPPFLFFFLFSPMIRASFFDLSLPEHVHFD